MRPDEFDAMVERALRKIPGRFRRRLDNVAILVEKEAPRPNLLGLYQGRPLTRRGVADAFVMPDKITIFQAPHERLAHTRPQLQRLIDETVWHEIAHYFGLNEREVWAAEKRRKMQERRLRAALTDKQTDIG